MYGTPKSILKGVTGIIFMNYYAFQPLNVVLTLANSADPGVLHFIWDITVSQHTYLQVSSIQRVRLLNQ